MSGGGRKLLVLKRVVFGACCAYSRHERHERSSDRGLGFRALGLGLRV